jgi:hypothetical protein
MNMDTLAYLDHGGTIASAIAVIALKQLGSPGR